jgi:hypothetical protein
LQAIDITDFFNTRMELQVCRRILFVNYEGPSPHFARKLQGTLP